LGGPQLIEREKIEGGDGGRLGETYGRSESKWGGRGVEVKGGEVGIEAKGG